MTSLGPGRRDVDGNHFTPRDYQIELLDTASKRNTIVQLGTGAGKTFIAVLLIKDFGVQVFPSFADNGKRVFFIVDKVTLVEQQAEHIGVHTTMTVGRMHGNLHQDVWQSKAACDKFMDEHNVVVMTAQVFLDLLSHAFFDMTQAALLIFDECHHALGSKHPYRLIMDKYRELEKDARPRVLGLTASLINDKTPPNQLEAKIDKLERILDCTIATASNLVAVSKFGTKPTETVIAARKFNFKEGESGQIIKLLENVRLFCSVTQEFHPDLDIDPRKYINEAVNRTIAVLKQCGPWCAWKVAQLLEKEQCKHSKQSHLAEKTSDFFRIGETAMMSVRRLLDPKVRGIRSLDLLHEFLPHKLIRLFDVLKMYQPEKRKEDDQLCGIIFVEQRMVAYVLKQLLKAVAKWEPELAYLKVDFVIGFSGASFVDSAESQSLHKRQDEVLKKFRRGELNLIVATNVLEEGVDVKHCNLVIKYDRPANYRAYVQSKGRARKKGARYVMLVEEDDVQQCNEDLRDFNEIERLLLRRYKTINNPSDMEVLDNVDGIIPPYTVDATGAKVGLSNAIQLVNRYCSMLPSDIFTRLVPENRLIPVPFGGSLRYSAELFLPINSPLKKSIRLESSMESKKLAQMAVALEACRQLHLKGELNDYLLPVGKDIVSKLMTQLDEDPDEYMPGVQAKVGSAKRKQLYDKRIARALHDSLPRVNEETLVYVLEMELMKEPAPESNPKRRKFAKPEETECCFGFLSGKVIPKIPPFPAYLRQGDMRIHVRRAKSSIRLNENTLQMLMQFHHYLFKNVLLLNKVNLDFALSPDTPLNTLIVPLSRVVDTEGVVDYVLNMKYVIEVVQCMEDLPRVPTVDERFNYKFKKEEYIDSVVMPWYRNTEQPSFYYVAEILEDMCPASQFPDCQFTTFNEYFEKKYKLKIHDQQQSLLDVDYTSNRMNLLLPRLRGAKQRHLKSSDNSQRQILVPELMDRHPIAAHLWNSICALPCLFYRINQLLLADELRERICRDALAIQNAIVPDDFHWAPLKYPATYEEKQSLIVSKIRQLREENKKMQPIETKNLGEKDKNMFDIGVWDPTLADGLEWNPSDLVNGTINERQSEDLFADGEMDDSVGLIKASTRAGDLSDDEEGEAVVLMDFAKHICAKTADPTSFAAPRADVIEISGWGDIEDVPPPDTSAPFQIVSVGGGPIDFHGFIADIQNNIFDVPRLPKTSLPLGKTTGSGTSTIPNERSALAQSNTRMLDLLSLEPLPTYENMELNEDHDVPLRVEEVVNLIDFDDEIDSDIPISRPKEVDSDEEFSSLVEGDMMKKKRDRESVSCVNEELKKGEILAPPLCNNFSFASASPAVSVESIMGARDPVTSSSLTSILDDDLISFDEPASQASSNTNVASSYSYSNSSLSHYAGTPFPNPSDAENQYGVSPCLLLQALTTSNANDGINLERLETIGDSFLKYAVTDYLYHMHTDQHEGKLSFARSKEVSNCNLYRLGKRAGIPSLIIGYKFDVQDSWLPPCYVPNSIFKAPNCENAEVEDLLMERVFEEGESLEDKTVKSATGWDEADSNSIRKVTDGVEVINFPKTTEQTRALEELSPLPYNMLTQQEISDKSIADAVEALIGAHLLTLGPEPTLKVMSWLGLKVMTSPMKIDPPLLRYIDTPEQPDLAERQLREYFVQFQLGKLEEKIGYRFNDKAYLVQAFTHASFYKNRITGCYQRLEFLGDAVLDYMITRFLFEHERQYSPGVLTDLRSALVNNTIFASLAVKYDFHKHFVAMCPGLHHMIEKFVKLCREKNFFGANFNAEMYMVTTEEEYDEGQEEDIEVPKAMGDIFESVAGAIYLDSGRDLDTVWRVFYSLMKSTIDECCRNPPRSPIRELLELEPERARFSRMERIMETCKVRVTVDIGKQFRFTGMGRNYRIAKATAAKRALRHLKRLEEERLKANQSAEK